MKSLVYLSAVSLTALTLGACSGSDREGPDERADVFGQLNDTGINACVNAAALELSCPQAGFPAQDAQAGRDAATALQKTGGGVAGFDWTKIGSNGDPLSLQNVAWSDEAGSEAAGSRWQCVVDHVTGLMWEVKESDPAHPRYAEHTYSWYSDDSARHGGEPGPEARGQCGTDTCSTQGYVDWVNEHELCGYSNWRMPSVTELESLAVLSKVLPAVDEDYFPNVMQPRFFTRQTAAHEPSLAWYVYFSDGSVSFTNKSDASHVRLVREVQANAQ